MHLAYSHPLNEHCTQHCSLHSFLHKRQSISAMFSSNKISQHNLITPTYHTDPCSSCTPVSAFKTDHTCHAHYSNCIAATHNITHSPCTPASALKTDHICHAHYSNCIAATHNITRSPCTSTCTPHPALPTTLPSTTFLCTQLTNTKHS